ncbi:toll-like receptor 3 [Haliotis asinina]|uniref:toll-like receptor 3 n=1 Tax=Haliotis asinina TaxID=109174 RepID=UPI0035323117
MLTIEARANTVEGSNGSSSIFIKVQYLFIVDLLDGLHLIPDTLYQSGPRFTKLSHHIGMPPLFQLLVLLLVTLTTASRHGNCGNNWCSCNNVTKQATCKGHGSKLTYIPRLPQFITYLDFSRNFLRHISPETFRNIQSLKLQRLTLTSNGITSMSADSFVHLTTLTELSLDGNIFSEKTLSETFPTLSYLPLERLSLRRLKMNDSRIFQRLYSPTIKSLILERNEFESYHQAYFGGLFNIQILSLAYNFIREVTLAYAPSLLYLTLKDNDISTFPNFCRTNGSFFPGLETLKLDHNEFYTPIEGRYIQCLKNLSVFTINSNTHIPKIKSNSFSEMPSLTNVILRNVGGGNLHIDQYAFNNSKIQYISIQSSGLYFKLNVHKDAFKGCSNLLSVDASFNRFSHTSDQDLTDWFGHLSSLTGIGLGSCGLLSFPKFISLYLPNLQYLKLYDNGIDGLPVGSLTPLKNLTHLWLSGNRLARIDERVFTSEVQQKLQIVDFMHNPFACNCELLWFLKWIKSDRKKFTGYPEKYVCSSPGEMKGRILSKVHMPEQSCLLPFPAIFVLIGVCGLCFFVLISVSVTYRYRWHIRHYMYKRRQQAGEFQRLDNVEIIYDAYVIYSVEDIRWIKGELIPKAEETHGSRLYIRDRDSLAGVPIVDNVVNNLNASKTILILLSNAMARDEQCQFELMFVQRHLEGERNPIILVLLEEVQVAHLTQSVYALVRMHPFIPWGDEEHARRFFWDRLFLSLNQECRAGPDLLDA